MSNNVHGMNHQQQNNQGQGQGQAQAADPSGQQNIFSFFPGQNVASTKHPRDENFCDIWRLTFCPRFKLCSAVFVIVLLQLIVFIAEIIHTAAAGTKEMNNVFFIGSSFWTLQEFGMRMPWLIASSGHVHRLILPSFLHYGICHLLISIILQISIGTLVESVMGALRFIIFFIVLCIGTNSFGAACTPHYALGADPIIFGYLGSLFTVMMVYWPQIEGELCKKICTILMIVVILIISILLITSQAAISAKYTRLLKIDNPDTFGMIGGFLYGFCGAMFLLPVAFKKDNKCQMRESIIAIVGLSITILITAIALGTLFGGETPKKYWHFDEAPEKI